MVHSLTAPQVMCTAVRWGVSAEASWKVIGFHASRFGSRWRRAAIRPVPAGSSWASRMSAMASPCQNSS